MGGRVMKLKKNEYGEGIPGNRSKYEIQSFLTNKIAALINKNVEDIDSYKAFSEFGIDSVQAVELSAELEDYLGNCFIEPTLLWDYPSIDAVSTFMSSGVNLVKGELKPHAKKDSEREAIAIVGMGCRLPGSPNLNAFWRLLVDGRDAVTEVPPDRWNIDNYYNANVKVPGKMNTRWGGFLDSVRNFDADFFGISPREASKMDPQQRLLLEVSWEALQDAGQVTEEWTDKKIGVFIGITQSDYADMLLSEPNLSDAYFGTGNALSIAANRLSYFYGFRGPSMAIDTACSSSLVSVYQACKSIWEQECEAALAGGVNLILSPNVSVQFSKTGFLSPDGKCKPFDAGADGYTRGEGVGIVVLKPLSKALAEGDRIYSIIRGGAINNDGRTNGLMAPNSEAQLLLLQEAYLRAGVSPKKVQYIEAHGTGTVLGDPIEVKALSKLLAEQQETGLCNRIS